MSHRPEMVRIPIVLLPPKPVDQYTYTRNPRRRAEITRQVESWFTPRASDIVPNLFDRLAFWLEDVCSHRGPFPPWLRNRIPSWRWSRKLREIASRWDRFMGVNWGSKYR